MVSKVTKKWRNHWEKGPTRSCCWSKTRLRINYDNHQLKLYETNIYRNQTYVNGNWSYQIYKKDSLSNSMHSSVIYFLKNIQIELRSLSHHINFYWNRKCLLLENKPLVSKQKPGTNMTSKKSSFLIIRANMFSSFSILLISPLCAQQKSLLSATRPNSSEILNVRY